MALPAKVVGGDLGTFYTDFTLWNPEMTESLSRTALVDTGASYVQVPASILDELGIRRERTASFTLADGSRREYSMGWTPMELEGDFASVYVIFGDAGSSICSAPLLWKPVHWPSTPGTGDLFRRTCPCRLGPLASHWELTWRRNGG